VHDGQAAVEHHDVVTVHRDHLERAGAVAADVHGDRPCAQAVGDRLRHDGLVLDDQHSHSYSLHH
jgi:hypothetical protein